MKTIILALMIASTICGNCGTCFWDGNCGPSCQCNWPDCYYKTNLFNNKPEEIIKPKIKGGVVLIESNGKEYTMDILSSESFDDIEATIGNSKISLSIVPSNIKRKEFGDILPHKNQVESMFSSETGLKVDDSTNSKEPLRLFSSNWTCQSCANAALAAGYPRYCTDKNLCCEGTFSIQCSICYNTCR